MTKEETEQKIFELTTLLKPKYKDIIIHIDLISGTNKINISLFWNRKSRDHYNESRTFRIISTDYDKILKQEIMKLL
jgi:glycerol-3-phosphate responsive antiterminator